MVLGAMVVARRVSTEILAPAVLVGVAVQGAGLGLPAAWLSIGFCGAMWPRWGGSDTGARTCSPAL
jgi:hypothetical protein